MEGGVLLAAFFFLAAAVAVVPFAQRWGLGSVLGYLAAGILIGPFGLKLVTNPTDILHFAEFGVVMMLFLIGLELEPAKLWRLRRPIVGLGGAQMLATTAVITSVAYFAGFTWQAGLAVGMALALSSTAIALQTLSERNLLGSAAGQSAFSVLLFQDVSVILILAILPLLAVGTGVIDPDHLTDVGTAGWVRALTVVGVVAGIILGGRYLLRPVFRFIAGSGSREIFTAFSLLLVVGIALAMQLIGLSPALGTFLAGVVLANSEYRLALESDIEPFKALLLGLFFISVGMSIQFDLVIDAPLQIALMVGGLIAVKMVLLAILAKIFGLGRDQNLVFTFTLAQGGEFAFVLFQFAMVEGALTLQQTGPLVVVVALTMAITPLLMLLLDKVIQPALASTTPKRPDDDMEPQDNPVIIIGYGRFGQIIGRFLAAYGIGTTVLDNDPDHVEVLRRFGSSVFYGDATRIDLLESAGGDRAKLIVIAIDDVDKTVKAAQEIRERFPKAKILARARNRQEVYRLMDAGVHALRRETFDSALSLAGEAMTLLGAHPYTVRRNMRLFADHDEQALAKGYEIQHDMESQASLARQMRDELAGIMQSDGADEVEDDDRHQGWGDD
jgi:monovalent cation:proton antiporter-2 (CPA2) family protein